MGNFEGISDGWWALEMENSSAVGDLINFLFGFVVAHCEAFDRNRWRWREKRVKISRDIARDDEGWHR